MKKLCSAPHSAPPARFEITNPRTVACDNGKVEPRHEKIAIFTKPAGTLAHAARQLPNGRWPSKLGNEFDIEHDLPGVECSQYGQVRQYLKRAVGPVA